MIRKRFMMIELLKDEQISFIHRISKSKSIISWFFVTGVSCKIIHQKKILTWLILAQHGWFNSDYIQLNANVELHLIVHQHQALKKAQTIFYNASYVSKWNITEHICCELTTKIEPMVWLYRRQIWLALTLNTIQLCMLRPKSFTWWCHFRFRLTKDVWQLPNVWWLGNLTSDEQPTRLAQM